MSFEGDKARLVGELADLQKQIKAEFDVAPTPKPAAGADPLKAPSTPAAAAPHRH